MAQIVTSSVILSPALACLLQLNHATHVHNSPLPEGAGCHVACALTTTLELQLVEHLLACLSGRLGRGQAEVTGHSGGARQELVELIVSDAALALLISLNEAIQDEVVEGSVLVRSWVVHGLLNEANVLLLGVVLDVVQANIASWDLGDGADNMCVCPLNELVKSERTTAGLVNAIEEDLVVHGTRHSITDIERGETIAAGKGRHLSQQLIELLGIDESILVSVNVAEGEGEEAVQLTLLLADAVSNRCNGPGLEGLLVVTPVICAPRAGRESAHAWTSNQPHRSEHVVEGGN